MCIEGREGSRGFEGHGQIAATRHVKNHKITEINSSHKAKTLFWGKDAAETCLLDGPTGMFLS